MRLLKLVILGAGAAYAYKRFVAGPGEGYSETAQAEPFSSEDLGDDAAPAGEDAAEPAGAAAAASPNGDTLTQPTWLKPADAEQPPAE